MRLTTPMRDTLEHAVRQELRRIHGNSPGRPPWPAHPSTLHALVRHGLLQLATRKSKRGHQLDTWVITEAGRDALKPRDVFRRQPDLYMTHAIPETTSGGHGEYTTDPRLSICREGVPITDPDTLNPAWDQLREERRHANEHRRTHARRLARTIRRVA